MPQTQEKILANDLPFLCLQSPLCIQGWGQMQTSGRWGELDGGRGDNGNVFAIVATEAVSKVCQKWHLMFSTCVIAPDSDWAGGKRHGKS